MARSNNIQVEPPAGPPHTLGLNGPESSRAPDTTVNVGSPIKNSIARVAGFFFGRDRAAQSQGEGTNEGEVATGANAMEEHAPAEEEALVPSSPPRSKYIPRKQPAVRDIYEHPTSPPESEGEEEIRANNPRKRPRTSVKAKQSIVPPKRSLRNTAVQHRPSRVEPVRTNKPSASSPHVPSSPPQTTKDVVEQPAKRPRGRPRKNPPASPTAAPARNVSSRATAPDQMLDPEEAPAPEEDEVEEEQEVGDEEEEEEEEKEDNNGISSILMNPSPIKVSRQIDGQQSRTVRGTFAKKKDKQPSEREESPEAAEIEDMVVDEIEEEAREAGDLLFEIGIIDDMISIADRVGYSYNKERQEWMVKTSHKVSSTNGKKMVRRLKATLEAYAALKTAIEPGDIPSLKKARHLIDKRMQQVQTESDAILTTRLGNPSRGVDFFDVEKTRVMLMDLYFLIIPDFLKIMKVAADVYPPKRSMNRWALQHLLALTTMLEDLATTAALQPKASNPRAESKGDTYNISKPTSLIRPRIRKIKKALSNELARGQVIQKASQSKASQAEQIRHLEDQERQRDEEIRRLRKENRRLQREAYEALCSQPRWGRLLRRTMEESSRQCLPRDPNSADLPEQRNGSQTYDQDQEAEAEDDEDPFTERPDDDEPRLSVFGKNNKNDSTRSRPLSEQEQHIFIECMMYEHGEDRYQKAAERLERSIEEIFTFAQDLQEAMDRKRETGQFMSPQDDWTYDIWVEKENN